jgi:hypothetical protein
MFKTKEILRALDATRAVATGGAERRVVRLDADDGGLRFSATDGTTFVSARVAGAAGGDAHTVGIIPDRLRLGVEASGGDDVSVTVEKDAVTLTSGARRVVVKTVEIPRPFDIPARPDKHDIDLTPADIAMRLPLSARAMPREPERPPLNGVSLCVHDGALRLVGTDGHRLHVATTGAAVLDAADGPLAWLPRAVVAHLGGPAGDGARIYAPDGADGRHWLEAEGITWAWVPPRPYPTWTAVLPGVAATTTLGTPAGFAEYLRASANVIDGRPSHGICLARAGGVLRASMPWTPDVFTEGSWPSEGVNFSARINPAYLVDALDAVGEGPIVELRGPLAPVVIRGEAGFAVVMPMKP